LEPLDLLRESLAAPSDVGDALERDAPETMLVVEAFELALSISQSVDNDADQSTET
jgi:hypothetical protein